MTNPPIPTRGEPGDAAARLDASKSEIVRRWEARVITALSAARRPARTVLSAHLPAVLAALIKAVSGGQPDVAPPVPPPAGGDGGAYPRVCGKPPPDTDTPDAGSLSQEIMELRLLRDTILEVLEAERPVTPAERQIILDTIDGAIQHTASELIRLQQRARYWSEEQFRIVVENVREYAVFMMDPEGHIVSWNTAAEDITQYRVDEIIGEHFSILFTPEDRRSGVPGQELDTALAAGKAEDERWQARKDGSRFWAAGVVSPLCDDTGAVCGFSKLMRDDTAAHLSRRRQAIQHAITRILDESTSLAEAASALLASIGEIAGWEFGALWTMDPAANLLRCQQVWHSPGKAFAVFEAYARRESLAPGVGLPGRCWSQKDHVWVRDVVQDENFPRSSAAARAGLHGAIAFPILLGAEVLGVFEFFSPDSRAPDSDFIEMMEDLGSQVGQFIERTRAEETRNRSESLKAGILQASLDAIIAMDVEGRVVEFNPAAERIFGYPREEAIGRLLADLLIPPSLREQHNAGLARFRETGAARIMNERVELTAIRSDGSEIPVELTIIRVPGPGPVLFTGFLRDITERRQLETQLRQRAEELVEADQHKNEFLAMLAHELRNPLGPIINSLHVLRSRGSGDPALVHAREVMERQVEHMSLLIDDLLNITRIAHGKIGLRRKALDVVELVASTVEDHRSHLEAGGLSLALDLPDKPVLVMGDRLRLAQVIGNLLSNAGKFTDPGGQVRVRVKPEEEMVTLSVSDTGVGIDPEVAPHLFKTFVQGKQSLDRSRGGLGLGLALVKGLIELHGGSVSVRSEGPGAGAEFSLSLPIVAGEAEVAEPSAPAASAHRGLRILVVEDNHDAAETLCDLLEMFGHDVTVAYSGPMGIECAKKYEPAVVICDLGLPGMDGYAVATELKRQPATAKARLIALSGYGREEDRKRSAEAGFELHLTKPVDPDVLRQLLDGS